MSSLSAYPEAISTVSSVELLSTTITSNRRSNVCPTRESSCWPSVALALRAAITTEKIGVVTDLVFAIESPGSPTTRTVTALAPVR